MPLRRRSRPHREGFRHFAKIPCLDNKVETQQIDATLRAQPAEKIQVLAETVERTASTHDLVGVLAGRVDGNPDRTDVTVESQVCPRLLVHKNAIGLDLNAARGDGRICQTLQYMTEMPTAKRITAAGNLDLVCVSEPCVNFELNFIGTLLRRALSSINYKSKLSDISSELVLSYSKE
jgi:hypothetical protein